MRDQIDSERALSKQRLPRNAMLCLTAAFAAGVPYWVAWFYFRTSSGATDEVSGWVLVLGNVVAIIVGLPMTIIGLVIVERAVNVALSRRILVFLAANSLSILQGTMYVLLAWLPIHPLAIQRPQWVLLMVATTLVTYCILGTAFSLAIQSLVGGQRVGRP